MCSRVRSPTTIRTEMAAGWKRTPAEREKILAAYKSGMKIEIIAERFGCNKSYPIKLARKAGVPHRNKQAHVAHR